MKFRLLVLSSLYLVFSVIAQDVGVTNLWTFKLPDRGTESSPALALDGTIYQGTFHGWLLALTPEGKLKWKFKAGREIKSSPAVAADGTIYFGSRDRNFYALGPDGKLKWKFATSAWVDSSPAIAADGTIYFGSWDTNFYALTPDGKLKWQFATDGIVDSSPAIGLDGTIYFGSHDKYFYALTPSGKLKWHFITGAEITASATIAADNTIYFSSTDGNLYALKPDGTEHWHTHTGGGTSSSPIIDMNGNLYIGVNKELWSLHSDGKARWQLACGDFVATSMASVTGNQLLVAAPWSTSGMTTTDAKFIWQFAVGYDFYTSGNINPQGIIYITSQQRLLAFQPLKNAAPPAKSSWPLWRADAQHTGRVKK